MRSIDNHSQWLRIFTAMTLVLFSVSSFAGNDDKGNKPDKTIKYTVVIEAPDTVLEIGEAVQLTAHLFDPDGAEVDTTFEWGVSNWHIGSVDQQGLFFALAAGKASVAAKAGRFSGTIDLIVEGDKNPQRYGYHITILPRDTVILVNESVAFTATLTDSLGTVIDTTFSWSLLDPALGTIDQNGLFTAGEEKGHTKVIATAGQLNGQANVVVIQDSALWQNRLDGYKVSVKPASAILAAGDSLQFEAMLTDTNGTVIDTSFTWSVEGNFGAIDENGLFYAVEDGRGFVYAFVGDLFGKATVRVREATGNNQNQSSKIKLAIVPEDTTLMIGETVTYAALLIQSNGSSEPVAAEWSVRGQAVGSISEDGTFMAEASGVAVIVAKADRYTATGRVMVVSEADTSEHDGVHIRLHDRDGSQVGSVQRIEEQHELKFTGLPFPLNLFNGGELVLPPGSLDEEISIDITLPDLAEIIGDTTIVFTDAILSGITFNVYVNGVLTSPYVFDPPVHLTLPYKAELMAALGITVDDIAMFFYNDDGTYESTGVTNMVVDTAANKIHADIYHFSQIVIGDAALVSATGISDEIARLPKSSRLYENYPNPFNPTTNIAFDVAGQSAQRVILDVYNLLGQKIKTVYNEQVQPGHYEMQWHGLDDLGRSVSSGMYIYRLKVGEKIMTKRMVLMK